MDTEASGDGERSEQDRTPAEVPPRANPDGLCVVGLGASAGGIPALGQFFENTPPDTGMAFVVVLHLSPDHESHLAAVLQKSAALPVIQVTEPVRVEPDRVYVIPPSRDLRMRDGWLHPSESEQPRGRRVPIDLFFRTLAVMHGPEAVAVVLSGTGADGAMGLQRVKEMGGLTLAQEPEDAQYDGMPRSAIATGMVDFVLPAADMPGQIRACREAARRVRLPDEAAPRPESDDAESALHAVLAHLRARTGHDFSHYKRATVLRRIGRRMQVRGVEDLPAYLDALRRHPDEADELLSDLLISVTNFFRDAETWGALEREVIPRLFADKGPDDEVRVWVVGCAGGDEAYSVAMLLSEHAARRERPPRLQVFATDIDRDAIAAAREGCFPETITADVSPERLRRWFVRDNQHYRVRKEVREIVLFAAHDILKDTPFSRLDLVTCRNLLIYLNREAQERVFELFHFALRPEGRLFLGASESIEGAGSRLFAPLDKPSRIYARRPVARPIPVLPPAPGRSLPAPRRVPEPPPAGGEERSPLPGELHRSLLELYAPPSALVDPEHEIVHLSDRAGRFLRFAGGEPTRGLLRVAHPDLRLDLRTALYAAARENRDQTRRARMALGDGERIVRIVVRPVREPAGAQGYFLVLFEEIAEGDAEASGAAPERAAEPVVLQMEEELTRTRAQLRSTVEQYESSVEELRASNEELQAATEELRSSNEELETSQEELQSVNEELITVNMELKARVDEVSRANGDLQNLLASTGIGTIFLDRHGRITRYTPAVETLFNIIPTDVGRPLTHLTHRLDYDRLPEDMQTVLERPAPLDRELRSDDGRWILARLLPYRTPDDRIDGVILTLVDITRRRQTEEELRASAEDLRASDERFRLLVDGARDYAMFLLDPDNRITFWSAGAERVFGWTEAEAVGQFGDIIFTAEDRERGAPREEMGTARKTGRAEDRRWHVRKDGSLLWADGLLTRLDDAAGNERGFVKITRDATAQREIEEALHHAHDELEARVAGRTAALTQTLGALEQALAERQRAEAARDQLLRRLATAEEEERKRIARELHDELGQQLTGFLLGLSALRERLTPEARAAAEPQLRHLQEIADTLGRQAHDLALELRPTALDDLGLRAAMGNMVEDWSARTGVAADFHSVGLSGGETLPALIKTTAYRVAQEALTNVARHARATRVSVVLERLDDTLLVIVEDDGVGFDPDGATAAENPEAERRLGLLGMHERAALAGGTLTVESTPGAGTTVYLRIPLEENHTDAT